MPGELVLIIEDNEMNRKLLRDVLEVEGYVTLETVTAEEGLEIARARHPALVLMDIRLPAMDGITALGELKRDPATREIPVVAVTASAMPMQRSEILAAGFDGYLTKPLDIDELVGEVRRVLATEAPT